MKTIWKCICLDYNRHWNLEECWLKMTVLARSKYDSISGLEAQTFWPLYPTQKFGDQGKGTVSQAAFAYVGSFTILLPVDQILLEERS